MGKVSKGIDCSVVNCSVSGFRSLSKNSLKGTDLQVSESSRRIYLCVGHYKTWKKETKSARKLDRVRYV